jgi:hypothetical protein
VNIDRNPSGWWWGFVESHKLSKGLLRGDVFDETLFVYDFPKK